MSYQTKVYRKQGGAELVVADGGKITVEAGGEIDIKSQNSGEPGAGISSGTGTVCESSVQRVGGIVKTVFLLDLTSLQSSTTDLDIIGKGTAPAYLGQITAARNGTILAGKMTCLEAPDGGVKDIDFYSAEEDTGVYDAGIATLTETALVTAGGNWAIGTVKALTGLPGDGDYLYLTGGAGGTAGTYTAGKFLIELEGYDA